MLLRFPETAFDLSICQQRILSDLNTMSEFTIKDEDLTSLKGKVIVLTGTPLYYHIAGHLSMHA